MEHCIPMSWWNRLWRPSPQTNPPQEPSHPQVNRQETPRMETPIITAPSTGDASTATYGTMDDIPKVPAVRTERTELTNVSPSSMHRSYTPEPNETSLKIPHHDVQDFAGVGAHLVPAANNEVSINVQPAENVQGQSEPDPLADVEVAPEEPSDDVPENPPTLEEELWDSRIAWPKDGTSYFIPDDELQRLVNVDAISAELQRYKVKLTAAEIEDKAKEILETARKLFVALIYGGSGESILDFLKEGLNDKDMPFLRVEQKNKNPKSGSFRLESRRHPSKIFQCMAWGRSKIEAFYSHQWWVLAPIFKESKKEDKKKPRHWDLEHNRVLPFVEDTQLTSLEGGGFSDVWAVRIHHAHQHLHKGTHPKNPNPKIAIKRLHSTRQQDFLREIEMLKAFSHHKNPHLIKLLATYKYQNKYHLMFPLAEANLRKYWEITKVAAFSSETMRWSLDQCKGIASALRSIHEYETSQPKPTAKPSSDLAVPSTDRHDASPYSSPDQFEAKFGRHGDIKPENILWSCENVNKDGCGDSDLGILLIADFGLMEFHRENTRSKVPFDAIAASPTYEPPDRCLKRNISRKYDIWSLGCVYLEFLTWIVGGVEHLSMFPDARMEKNFSGDISDDTFFSLRQHPNHDPNDPQKGMHAIVRPKVAEWMKTLRTMPRNSEFTLEFLDLVENQMLRVNQEDRISCAKLNTLLSDMVKKANENPRYLTETIPVKIQDSPKLNDEMSSPSPREGSALPKRDSVHVLDGIMLQRTKSPELKLEGNTLTHH